MRLVAEERVDKARVDILDAHEEFVQHIESGQRRIRGDRGSRLQRQLNNPAVQVK